MALSLRDQERLRKGREEAEKKMAAERERIARVRVKERLRAATHYMTVTGPDGVAVELWVRTPGEVWAAGGIDDSGPLGLILLAVVLIVLMCTAIWHFFFYRNDFSVRAKVPGRRVMRIRLSSEAAAVDRMNELADEIRARGVVALS